jgi:putative SOS response-associated peptidase YedK
MCGRYYRRSDKQKIAEAFQLGKLPDGFVLPPDYNVAPTTFQPVIRYTRETGERELVMMRWGMIPNFAKSIAEFKGLATINARAETLTTNALWKRPFERHRCLIPADGFYEWKKLAPKTKQPYAFSIISGEPVAFAGLWDAWKEPKSSVQGVDTWLQSFTIITTTPNELTRTVHNRMPVIVRPEDHEEWLSRIDGEEPPAHLLRPFPAGEMEIHPCNPTVGNVKNNGPEMLECPHSLSGLPLIG